MASTILGIILMCCIYKLNAFLSPQEVIPDHIHKIPRPSSSFIKWAAIFFLTLTAIGFIMGYIIYNY